MSRLVGNSITLCLSCIGCLIAVVLAYSQFRCGYAATGPSAVGAYGPAIGGVYGHIGSIPSPLIGFAMYLGLLVLCLRRYAILSIGLGSGSPLGRRKATKCDEPRTVRRLLRILDCLVWVVAATGTAVSVHMQDVALNELHSFCPICITSACVITVICLFASRDLFLNSRRLTTEQRYLSGGVILVAAGGLLLFGPDTYRDIRSHLEPTIPVSLPAPSEPPPPIVTTEMQTKGVSNANYTIVAFLDYQCPHCKIALDMIDKSMSDCPIRFRFAIRHYPLSQHHWAIAAARTAEAAGRQGKFWEMSRLLFAHRDEMNEPDFTAHRFSKYAAELRLDVQRFNRDEKCDRIMSKVDPDAAAARTIKVQMIPTFFIVNQTGAVYQITGNTGMKSALEDPNDAAWR